MNLNSDGWQDFSLAMYFWKTHPYLGFKCILNYAFINFSWFNQKDQIFM